MRIACAILLTTFYNCSIEAVEQLTSEVLLIENEVNSVTDVMSCDGDDPKSRITNNSDLIVDFEILDMNGVLLTHAYGVNPGEVSEWKMFPIGLTNFKISTSESVKVVSINMLECMTYDVAINENNHLNTSSASPL